jgi:hypothetical protein
MQSAHRAAKKNRFFYEFSITEYRGRPRQTIPHWLFSKSELSCLGRLSHALMAGPHMAGWRVLGKLAGPARNREMVESGADLCIALHRTLATSKGTKDCVRQALAAGIPVYLIEDDSVTPRRVQADDPRLARA